MKKTIPVFILIFEFLISCKKKEEPTYVIHINGKVIDAITQQPISGAVIGEGYSHAGINVYNGPIYATTDTNGNYSFTYPHEFANSNTPVYVHVQHTGYGAYNKEEVIQIPNKEYGSNFNILLKRNIYIRFNFLKTTLTDSAISVEFHEPVMFWRVHITGMTNQNPHGTFVLTCFS